MAVESERIAIEEGVPALDQALERLRLGCWTSRAAREL
jgi:hypothetical protein